MDQELAAFCQAEHRRLVGALSLYCQDRQVAEELAQDALLRVVTHWHRVRRLDHPSAWVYRVAINLANSYLRRRLAERRATPQASTAAWNGTELIAWDYLLEAAAYDPVTDEWRRLPSPPLDSMECGPASVPVAGGDTFGDYCGAVVMFDSRNDRWHRVPAGPSPRTGFVELVEAGPVVLLLERSTGDRPALLAYRNG